MSGKDCSRLSATLLIWHIIQKDSSQWWNQRLTDFHFFSFLRSLMWVHPTVTVSVLRNHHPRVCHHLQSRFSVTLREAWLAHLYQKGSQDSHEAFSPRPSTETSARFGGENVLATDFSGTMGRMWALLPAKTYQFWTILPLYHFAPKPPPALQMLLAPGRTTQVNASVSPHWVPGLDGPCCRNKTFLCGSTMLALKHRSNTSHDCFY